MNEFFAMGKKFIVKNRYNNITFIGSVIDVDADTYEVFMKIVSIQTPIEDSRYQYIGINDTGVFSTLEWNFIPYDPIQAAGRKTKHKRQRRRHKRYRKSMRH